MSSPNIHLIKQLRDRTNLSLDACKKALAASNDNIETAIDILKRWGELKAKEKENLLATEGVVLAKVDQENGIGGIIEVNCSTDFCSKSLEFRGFCNRFLEQVMYSRFELEKITELRQELSAKTGENIVCRRNHYLDYANANLIYMTEYNHPGNKLAVLMSFEVSRPEIKAHKSFIEFAEDTAMQIAAMSPITISKDDIPNDMIDNQKEIFSDQIRKDGKPEKLWAQMSDGKMNNWFKEVALLEQNSVKNPKQSINDLLQETIKRVEGKIRIVEFFRYELGGGNANQ